MFYSKYLHWIYSHINGGNGCRAYEELLKIFFLICLPRNGDLDHPC